MALPAATLVFLICGSAAAADEVVYDDALGAGWQDWSWATHDLSHTTVVHAGNNAISFEPDNWEALSFYRTQNLTVSEVERITFWIRGAAPAGQNIRIALVLTGTMLADVSLTPYIAGGSIPSGSWAFVDVPITAFGLSSNTTFNRFWLQDGSGGNQPTVYVDDVSIAVIPPPTITPELSVDVGQDRAPISPDIYGMNFCPAALAYELRLPVNRWGGNSTTRYNWINDTANHARDWYYENIPNEQTTDVLNLPATSAVNRFLDETFAVGSKPLLTMPCIGWTPKTRAYLGAFGRTKYGDQQSYDPWRPEWGNGVLTNNSLITNNDPADTSVTTTPAYATGWVNYLKSRYGTAAAGGVRLYNLDNEPDLWHDTHRDVHPQPMTYDELRDFGYAYGHAIKQADPGALVLGPVSWGWTNYFTSPADSANNTNTDRLAHGNQELAAWYLQQMAAWEQTTGTRILDYLDLHFYPQGQGTDGVWMYSGEQTVGNQQTQALRLRQTRTLWDLTYNDESWIADNVRLIPRMRDWVNANYPGTKLAVGEYNFGAMGHMNGAVAQADVLGIFGREQLDLATLWQPPASTDPAAFAFRVYRNYDAGGSRFGETRVRAISTDQGQVSVYASQRTASGAGGSPNADGALTIVCVNKAFSDVTTSVTLAAPPTGGGAGGGPVFSPAATAQVWRYSSANPAAIEELVDVPVQAVPGGSGATRITPVTFPAQSITMIVVPSTVAVSVRVSRLALE